MNNSTTNPSQSLKTTLPSVEALDYWLRIGDLKETDEWGDTGMRIYPDYYLFCQWANEPFQDYNEIDWLIEFPIKKHMDETERQLKRQADDLLHAQRDIKNWITQEPGNAPIYEWALEANEKDLQVVQRKLSRLRFLSKGGEQKGLDIQQAKKFPIPQILELDRGRKARCPWHDDKNPSLQYFPKTNSVYCFSCSKGGDTIDLAMAIWNIEFKEAVARLTN